MHSSRRTFLGGVGAASLRAGPVKPDLLLVNANICELAGRVVAGRV
ncbi:MAG: hypothetical protein LAP87_05265 [Acidobacteriia bacterium]|nr:hypothetical protein [Terriglobia bacterium]